MDRQEIPFQFLEREGMDKALEKIKEVPLTVVVASVGYGKSTAVLKFMEKQTDAKVIWISLRWEEEDDEWIWKRICSEAKKAKPSLGSKLLNLSLPRNRHEIGYLTAILNKGIHRPVYVVIDDYHEINSASLNFLIESLAYEKIQNFHIVLISRIFPDIPSQELWLKGCCECVDQEMFLLTREEVKEFFLLHGVSLEPKVLDEIYEYTDGWISAVCLSLLNYKKGTSFHGIGSVIFLLKTSVYDKMPLKSRQVLMKLSVLDTFTIEQAAFLLEEESISSVILKMLGEIGFIKYDAANKTYQIHSLLRTIADVELKDSDIDRKVLYDRSGQWFETQKEWISAVVSYQKSENIDRILHILKNEGCGSLYEKAPVIISSIFFGKSGSTDMNLSLYMEHYKIYLNYIYSMVIRGEYKKGMRLFEEARDYCEEHYEGERYRKIRGELYIIESLVCFNDLEKMTECLRNAYQLLDMNQSEIFQSDVFLTYGAPEIIVLYHRTPGNLKQIIKLEKEFGFYYSRLINGLACDWGQLFEAEYLFSMGKIEEADKAAGIACEKAKIHQKKCVISSSYYILLGCDIFLGRKLEFERRMKELKEMMEDERRVDLLKDEELVASYMYSMIGKTELMAEWLQSLDLCECNEVVRSTRSACYVYGNMLMLKGEWAKLEALAEEMLKPYRSTQHIYAAIRANIYKSVSSFHLYGMDQAVSYLKEAADLAQPDGIVMTFAFFYGYIKTIMEKLGKENLYIMSIIPLCRKLADRKEEFCSDKKQYNLTNREKEMLVLLKEGYKNMEISEKLHVALVTVEKTLSSLYHKLGVANRTEAVYKMNDMK